MRKWAERLLEPVVLTQAGRPVLRPGEVETQLIDRVDLESDGAAEDPLKSGLLILTNARVVWLHDQPPRGAFAVPLASISQVREVPKRGLKSVFATPRLRLELWISANGRLCSLGAAAADSTAAVLLVFRGHSNVDSFLPPLNDLLKSRSWEALPTPSSSTLPSSSSASAPSSSSWNPSRAGVSGILRKEQEQWEQSDKDMQEAFHNLNALMGKAKEMVLLADKLRAKVLTDDSGSKQEIQDWLLSVGITSPVTKESAGSLYHQQLSRQLADFVWAPLQSAGGMLAVTDVYCLFNRARGSELISPEDLLQACQHWERLDVPVSMHRFESGTLVVQIKSKTDAETFSRIMILVQRPENSRLGVGARDAAKCLGISPTLAKEQLIAAENQGLLCRDDGAEGLRFFANFFKDAQI